MEWWRRTAGRILAAHGGAMGSGEARANLRVMHLSCGCIDLCYRWCIYGEILEKNHCFNKFWVVHLHPLARG